MCSGTPSPILHSARPSRSWRILHSLDILGRAVAALPCPSLYGGTYLTDYLPFFFFFFLSQTKQSACVPPSPRGCCCRSKEPRTSVPQQMSLAVCQQSAARHRCVRESQIPPSVPTLSPGRDMALPSSAGWWHGQGRLSKVSWSQHVCTAPESCCLGAHIHPFVGCLLSVQDLRLFFRLRAQLCLVTVPSGGLQ